MKLTPEELKGVDITQYNRIEGHWGKGKCGDCYKDYHPFQDCDFTDNKAMKEIQEIVDEFKNRFPKFQEDGGMALFSDNPKWDDVVNFLTQALNKRDEEWKKMIESKIRLHELFRISALERNDFSFANTQTDICNTLQSIITQYENDLLTKLNQ